MLLKTDTEWAGTINTWTAWYFVYTSLACSALIEAKIGVFVSSDEWVVDQGWSVITCYQRRRVITEIIEASSLVFVCDGQYTVFTSLSVCSSEISQCCVCITIDGLLLQRPRSDPLVPARAKVPTFAHCFCLQVCLCVCLSLRPLVLVFIHYHYVLPVLLIDTFEEVLAIC